MSRKSELLALLRAKWNPPATPTITFEGKTVLITGSNAGLGFYAAQHFVRLGVSQLVLGVRDVSKGEAARLDLEKSGAPSKIDVLQLDMNSFASVAAFTDLVSKSYKQIDIVVLNAGLYNLQYSTSPSGWEETLQVNTLSTTLLALLLLPILHGTKKEDPSSTPHLVLVSSGQHAIVSPTSLPPLTNLTHPLILQGPSNPYHPLQRHPPIRGLKAPPHVRP